jgi:hypothetical protein
MSVSHGRYPTAMPPAGMSGPYGAPSGVRSRGRALPIVVASGLALGVFAGLLVVHGTSDGPEDSPTAAVVPADASPSQPGGAPGAESPPPSAPAQPGLDAGAGDRAEPPAKSSIAVVSFSVRPQRAHIFVNGTELDGTSTEVQLTGGSARIDVVIKSHGHRSHRETYTVTADQTIEVALRKRDEPAGPGSLLDIR